MPANKRPLKALVVGAYAPELKPFVDLGRRHFVIQDDIAYLSAGVGVVAACFGLTHFLEDHLPQIILGVGTAGSVCQQIQIGDLVRVSRASFQSGRLDTYSVKKMKPVLFSHEVSSCVSRAFQKEFQKIKTTVCYCPLEISKTRDSQKRLQEQGYDVEHLEAYAYGFVAQKFKIPVQVFLGITNTVGPKAHQEWFANQAKVSRHLAQKVKQLMVNI